MGEDLLFILMGTNPSPPHSHPLRCTTALRPPHHALKSAPGVKPLCNPPPSSLAIRYVRTPGAPPRQLFSSPTISLNFLKNREISNSKEIFLTRRPQEDPAFEVTHWSIKGAEAVRVFVRFASPQEACARGSARIVVFLQYIRKSTTIREGRIPPFAPP